MLKRDKDFYSLKNINLKKHKEANEGAFFKSDQSLSPTNRHTYYTRQEQCADKYSPKPGRPTLANKTQSLCDFYNWDADLKLTQALKANLDFSNSVVPSRVVLRN